MLLFFYGGLFLTSHIFVDISFFSDAFRVVTKNYFKLPGRYKKWAGNQTARDFFWFYFRMKVARDIFIVARRNP